MTALLAALGLALLLLPGTTRRPVQQLDPAEWARYATFALRLGHRSLQAALALGAAPTVLHALGIDHVATACHEMFGPVAPGGPVIGWTAALLLTWTLGAEYHSRRQIRTGFERCRVDAWLGHHETIDDVDIVTLPADVPVAYAVPAAGGGQIVVSSALAATLDDDELGAVLAHERSHIQHHHHRHLELLGAIDATYRLLPAVATGTARIRLALERWADEDAAVATAHRDCVRSALAKTTQLLLGPAMAFNACAVIDRIHALDHAAPTPTYRTRAAALAPITLTATAVAGVASCWIAFTHHGIAGIIGLCPV